MPALPTIANCFRVTFDWHSSNTGTTAHNVVHFGAVSGSESDLEASLGANLTGAMFQAMSSNSSLIGLDIIKLDGSSGTVAFGLDGSLTGTGGADALVAPAVIVSLRTGLRGPRHRGRIFLPFPAESQTNGGIIDSPTVVADMQTAWTDFATAMTGDLKPLVVASYLHADMNSVTALVVERFLGTQRRRQDALR